MSDTNTSASPQSERVRVAYLLDNLDRWHATDQVLAFADDVCSLGWENAVRKHARKIEWPVDMIRAWRAWEKEPAAMAHMEPIPGSPYAAAGEDGAE